MKDLFEDYESLPVKVLDILCDYDQLEQSYNTCKELVSKLESVGYTCDYGLDAVPFNLTEIS